MVLKIEKPGISSFRVPWGSFHTDALPDGRPIYCLSGKNDFSYVIQKPVVVVTDVNLTDSDGKKVNKITTETHFINEENVTNMNSGSSIALFGGGVALAIENEKA